MQDPDPIYPTDPSKTLGEIIDNIAGTGQKIKNTCRKIKSLFHDENDKELRPGDINGITRKCIIPYDHYGVYVNEDSVIHFSSKDSDISPSNNSIIETDFKTFKRNDDCVFKLIFPEKYSNPSQVVVNMNGFMTDQAIIFKKLEKYIEKVKKYKVYSTEETIQRAKSKLGCKDYNLLTNNCEYFAIWCKTGLSESRQVEMLLDILDPNNYKVY